MKSSESDGIDTAKLEGYLKSCNALVSNVKYEENKINQFNDALQNKDLIVSETSPKTAHTFTSINSIKRGEVCLLRLGGK